MSRAGRTRRESPATARKRERASANYAAAARVIQAGGSLRVSNRTDVFAGVVHGSTAAVLVRRGLAQHPADPDREGWFRLDRIEPRTRQRFVAR